MRIEYVLLEKATKDKTKAEKARIQTIFSQCYPEVSDNSITISGKRKNFELHYAINCGIATSSDSKDYVYNISFECLHSEKSKCSELLEKAHLAFRSKIDVLPDYHLIVAEDGLSEYYCNRAYPKYQKFERGLRHLIFKIVTKAYGNLWTTQTLSPEMRKKLKEDIKSRNGGKKDDTLIEAALHEMTMGQLIDYLFYGSSEISIQDYLDEHLPFEKMKDMSKDELIQIMEKGRRKSVWNMYFANQFLIDEPKRKLGVLRANRNKVAHCKQFHSSDYKETITYLDSFMVPMETAIQNATFQEPISIRDVLCGFGEYTIHLKTISQQIGQAIAPALKHFSEISESILKAYNQTITIQICETMSGLAKTIQDVYRPIEYPSIALLPSSIIDGEEIEADNSTESDDMASDCKDVEEDGNADA